MLNKLNLVLELTKGDLKERYASTSFGRLWLLISPLITIFIYTVIFSDFMKMRMNLIESKYAYSIYLIPGLSSFNFFSTVVLRLSTSILDKANIIKKINIPTWVYYLSITFSEFIIYFVSMIFGILFLVIIGHYSFYVFNIFFLMILISLFAFFLGVIISLFMPFFRDLKEAVPIILQLWFWATPIIYVKELIYSKYPFIVDYNPLYYFIEPMQMLFLYYTMQKKDIFVSLLIVIFLALTAAYLYKKLIPEIKDII